MKKVISFSLYKAPDEWEKTMDTSFNKYIRGLKENIKYIEEFYPEWVVYIYYSEFIDDSIFDNITSKNEIKKIKMSDIDINAMQWRFLPNDEEDVEYFIVRDIDSRPSKREVTSVNEWISSGKKLHIMRDHPHHRYKILGGMWGMKSIKEFNMSDECKNYNRKNGYNSKKDWYDKWWDMNFLRDYIYPNYVNDSFINASYHKIESWSNDFTVERDNGHFIGEIFDENNTRGEHFKLL